MARIVSDEGYGKNDYIETQRPLVVITAPGPGSGKMATCLSQLYHEHKRGIKAGYAKFETFPIWNLPLKHPVNLAYEAATADLNDVNMIDPFHLEAYGVTTVNYNRDIEIFPVVNAMFELIAGKSPYKSPTDMGVNMAGNCIVDDAVCCEASRKEIVRRYYKCLCEQKITGTAKESERYKLELLMNQAGLTMGAREVEKQAHARSEATGGAPAAAIELSDGTVITGKTGPLLGATASALINALKYLAGIPQETDLVSAAAIEPIQTLKTNYPSAYRRDPDRPVQLCRFQRACRSSHAPAAQPQGLRCALHRSAFQRGQQHPEPSGNVPDLRPRLRGRGSQVP